MTMRELSWTVALYLCSAAGVYLVGVGLFNLGSAGALGALWLVPFLALVFPPARDYIKAKLRVWPSVGWALLFATVPFFMMIDQFGGAAERQAKAAELAAQQASAERVAKAKRDREADFAANKAAILARINEMASTGRPTEAMALASQYLSVTRDPDLAKAHAEADVALMYQQDRDGGVASLDRQLTVYQTLSQREPTNKRFQTRLKEIEAALAAQKVAAAQQKRHQELEASIKSQFSGWDGSHRGVVQSVKAAMHNPDSFKHVETRYKVNDDNIAVFMTYRGTNAFGGVVTNRVTAVVDAKGNVLSIVDQ